MRHKTKLNFAINSFCQLSINNGAAEENMGMYNICIYVYTYFYIVYSMPPCRTARPFDRLIKIYCPKAFTCHRIPGNPTNY